MTKKLNVTFSEYDTAELLKTREDMDAYIAVVAEESPNDPKAMLKALETVARAENMSALARKTNISREGLRKALSGGRNPTVGTLAKLADALGYQLSLTPKARV